MANEVKKRVSAGQFIQQVRTEAEKIVWPTWNETLRTSIMVLIMTLLLGVFFFAVDSLFAFVVKQLIGLLG